MIDILNLANVLIAIAAIFLVLWLIGKKANWKYNNYLAYASLTLLVFGVVLFIIFISLLSKAF